jgi:hypothetical protein
MKKTFSSHALINDFVLNLVPYVTAESAHADCETGSNKSLKDLSARILDLPFDESVPQSVSTVSPHRSDGADYF